MKVSTRRVVDRLATHTRQRQMVQDGVGLGSWVSCQRTCWNDDTEQYVPSGAPFTAQVWMVQRPGLFVLADGTSFHWASASECTVLGQAQEDAPLDIDVAA